MRRSHDEQQAGLLHLVGRLVSVNSVFDDLMMGGDGREQLASKSGPWVLTAFPTTGQLIAVIADLTANLNSDVKKHKHQGYPGA